MYLLTNPLLLLHERNKSYKIISRDQICGHPMMTITAIVRKYLNLNDRIPYLTSLVVGYNIFLLYNDRLVFGVTL